MSADLIHNPFKTDWLQCPECDSTVLTRMSQVINLDILMVSNMHDLSAVGFCSEDCAMAHYNTAFKKKHGFTPEEYDADPDPEKLTP
tara:strand:- start:965 stop:1225 length:261 start_codon:yes stop_codon:yes gene_type:complete